MSTPTIVPSRIYSLASVSETFGTNKDELVKLAADGHIELCLPIPPGKRAHHIDLSCINPHDKDFGVERRHFTHQYESRQSGEPLLCDVGTIALIVHGSTCRLVWNFGFVRQRLFGLAYLYPGVFLWDWPAKQLIAAKPGVYDPYDDEAEMPDIPECFFGIYPDDMRFDYQEGKGFQAPEEVDISRETLCISGTELMKFLTEFHQPEQAATAAQASQIPGSRIYPLPLPNPVPPTYAAYRVKMLFDLAEKYWKPSGPTMTQQEYDEIRTRVTVELRKERKNGLVHLTDNDIVDAAYVIQPLWARQQLLVPQKETRTKTHITPEFEKMVLVAGKIESWRKEAVAGGENAAKKRVRPHPKNQDVENWLCSTEHFMLSGSLAITATKLLRHSPGVGGKKKRGKKAAG